MAVYHVKSRKQSWDGEAIGILILDAAYPRIPGNVGNASTFTFPVRYKKVKNASIERLLKKNDKSLLKAFIEAAIELQQEGVRAITGACGFMAVFQREIAASVNLPVFLSSLLQIPFISQITKQKIGIITADSSSLTNGHFESVGVDRDIPLVIGGMEGQKEFRESVLEEKGTLDSDAVSTEVCNVARELVAENNDIGSILLECSDLPPYAHAVQREVNLPVFDFCTMINYVQTALLRSEYSGFM
ncbi:MAG: aspartate/glutamate racemase family protein [Thermodesulfobacteriota bacterium]|nr:aspartate/glutamate racemase family protein [Thermodesulfobacteriota bacterium]